MAGLHDYDILKIDDDYHEIHKTQLLEDLEFRLIVFVTNQNMYLDINVNLLALQTSKFSKDKC